MIRILVKGTPEDAHKAATARGIPLFDVAPLHADRCIAEVPETYRMDVIRWMCEPHRPAPYPAGTLMFHT